MLFKFISKFFIFNLSEKIVNAIQMGSITLRIFFVWKFTRFFLFSFELSMTHLSSFRWFTWGSKRLTFFSTISRHFWSFAKLSIVPLRVGDCLDQVIETSLNQYGNQLLNESPQPSPTSIWWLKGSTYHPSLHFDLVYSYIRVGRLWIATKTIFLSTIFRDPEKSGTRLGIQLSNSFNMTS